jgi:hypothetical protein
MSPHRSDTRIATWQLYLFQACLGLPYVSDFQANQGRKCGRHHKLAPKGEAQ